MKNTKLFALLLCATLTISMLATGCSGGKLPRLPLTNPLKARTAAAPPPAQPPSWAA